MKKSLLLILILSSISITNVFGAPILSLPDLTVTQGQSTTFQIGISNTSEASIPIDGFNFRVTFDPVGVSISGNTSSLPLFSVVGGTALNPSNISYFYDGLGVTTLSDGSIARFTATGLQPGLYLFNFTEVKFIGGENATVVPMTLDGGSLQVNAVPIPAAVWLLGSGVVGLVALKRRKKA